MPIVRLSPSGPEIDIDSLDMSEATLAGRPRGGGEGQAEPLTPDQALQVLSEANIVIPSWDFNGVIAAAGVLAVPGWTAFGAPTIIQRDVGAGHSANHPGQLQMQIDPALAQQSSVYFGPYDWSTLKRFRFTVLIPADGGNELLNCSMGFGLVVAPDVMSATIANASLWADNYLICYVRSNGTGAGSWTARRQSGTAAITALGVPVVADTWYDIEAVQDMPTATWTFTINGVIVGSRASLLTTGIVYLALGMVRGAGAGGRNIVADLVEVETTALNRSAA